MVYDYTTVNLDDNEMIVLYNPSSGDQFGKKLTRFFTNSCINLIDGHCVYGFKFDEIDQACLKITNYLQDTERKIQLNRLVVVCGGGDGSLSTIIDQLMDRKIDVFDKRLVFSGLPLGTGNDSSQSQGWSSHITRQQTYIDGFFNELESRLYAPCSRYDIWRIRADPLVEQDMVIFNGNTRVPTFNHLMCHYMSIGLQGEVGMKFERNRQKSRWGNFREFARQSARIIFKDRILRLGDFIESIDGSGILDRQMEYTLKPSANKYVELIISNIMGIWGRRVPLWQTAQMEPSVLLPEVGATDISQWNKVARFNDKMLEAYAIESRWSYFLKQFPWFRTSLKRFGQFKWMRLNLLPEAKISVMLDGDFYTIQGAKTLELSHVGQINMVTGPDYINATSSFLKQRQYTNHTG